MSAWYRDIVRTRLVVQRLAADQLPRPEDIVSWLGAVQAQDYPGAKWALGLRGSGFIDADVDEAFDAGRILRTHVMRPTWHFVAPADLRWLLKLTAPRVHAFNGFWYRLHELDERTLRKSRVLLERALRGGRYLTRAQLADSLARGGVKASGPRLAALVMHAELERVVCSGPRHGRQFTYALFDERVPPSPDLDREEALAELTRRYFMSHGPATVRDYAWWSGLTMREVRKGVDVLGRSLTRVTVGGREYYASETQPRRATAARGVYILPNYDECLIAYKDRWPSGGSDIRDPYPHHLIVNGSLAGSWRRTMKAGVVTLDVAPYERRTRTSDRGLEAAAKDLGRFIGVPTRVRTHIPERRSRTKISA